MYINFNYKLVKVQGYIYIGSMGSTITVFSNFSQTYSNNHETRTRWKIPKQTHPVPFFLGYVARQPDLTQTYKTFNTYVRYRSILLFDAL